MPVAVAHEQLRYRPQQPKQISYLQRLGHWTEDLIVETRWCHFFFKLTAYLYILFILWLGWKISPFSGLWKARQPDRLVAHAQDLGNYFNTFEGSVACNIHASNLYVPPPTGPGGLPTPSAYCQYRSQLLQAMSDGGRVGFDTPYTPRSCHYKWYSVAEICMILERFEAVVFVGDDMLKNVYAALTILLRHDLQHGALKTWEMTPGDLDNCRCDQQFTTPSCAKHFLTNTEESNRHGAKTACRRTPHAFLRVDSSPVPDDILAKLKSYIPPAPRSNFKSIPIIHSLTSSTSIDQATHSLTEVLQLADRSKRKTPMLWLGPTAAGHIEMKGRKGNQEIWRFAQEMNRIATEKDVETLGLWNLTVQASSWDGKGFGEEVAIVSAMMVVNWLGRLESN